MYRSLRAISVVSFFLAVTVLSSQLPPTQCTPDSPFQYLASGVKYYDCSSKYPAVHIVAVDRTLPAMEIQLLMDRNSNDPLDKSRLRRVEDLAVKNKAVVAINGHYWIGAKGFPWENGDLVSLGTTIFIQGTKRSNNRNEKLTIKADEPLMGFKPGGLLGIHAKRIRYDEVEKAENIPYRYQMYGSDTAVLRDRECVHWKDDAGTSIVGYSDKEIIFLSTASGVTYKQQQLCPVLGFFNVTDAVRQDGGPSAALYVGGSLNKHVNPLGSGLRSRLYSWAFGSARHVAYAIGLVPINPTSTAVPTSAANPTSTAKPTGPIICETIGDDLRYRKCPNTSPDCPAFGQYPIGTMISFVCKTTGESINGDNSWGKNTAGAYVSLFYVNHECAKTIPSC